MAKKDHARFAVSAFDLVPVGIAALLGVAGHRAGGTWGAAIGAGVGLALGIWIWWMASDWLERRPWLSVAVIASAVALVGLVAIITR